jgi:hypothetical protein
MYLKALSPACGAILGGIDNFRRWGLIGEGMSVEVGFQGNLVTVPFLSCSLSTGAWGEEAPPPHARVAMSAALVMRSSHHGLNSLEKLWTKESYSPLNCVRKIFSYRSTYMVTFPLEQKAWWMCFYFSNYSFPIVFEFLILDIHNFIMFYF